MVRTLTLSALTLSTLLAAGTAVAADPATTSNGILVGEKSMTLYTYDKDTANSGKSVCNDKCATNWPPLKAAAGAKGMGNWTVISRDDGTTQYAYKGQPLYYFIKDKAAGDKTGDGVGGAWHVVKP
jgi:predicted lipoprotein with Yx(FWY)xxD motif